MLTKDLLAYKIKGAKVNPVFIDVQDAELLSLAEQLIACFDLHLGKTQEALKLSSDFIIQGAANLNIAKGLFKLLMDKAVFSNQADGDPIDRREKLFARSTAFFTDRDESVSFDEVASYRASVLSGGDVAATVEDKIYPDLPQFDVLEKIKTYYPLQLLQRYNLAQVQGLLISSQSLALISYEQDAVHLRRIFKCLKFFRLLASITQKKDKRGYKTTIVIDGPLSILDNSKKYGLQIANFFPAICLLPEWEISAEVKPKRAYKKLKLDQHSQLVSYYQQLSAFVPEEVKMFAAHFEKTVDDWQFVSETPFIKKAKGRIIFPDFTLQHRSGKVLYLEVFHRWHRGQLNQRLEDIQEGGEENIILAIDRFLLKGEQFQESIAGLDESRHFLFSDYPSVTRLQKLLKLHMVSECMPQGY